MGIFNLYIQIAGLSFRTTYVDIVEAIAVDITYCDAGACGGEHGKQETVAVEIIEVIFVMDEVQTRYGGGGEQRLEGSVDDGRSGWCRCGDCARGWSRD